MQTEVELKISNPKMADSLPAYTTPGSAGLGLHACLNEAVVLQPDDVYLVPIGLVMRSANPACAAILLPRSGLDHKHGIVLGNLVDLIGSDCQGELEVSLWNRGKEALAIEPMERIAQMMIVPAVQTAFKVTDEFVANKRGEGRFDNTGKI